MNRSRPYLAVSVAFCLLVGCASHKTPLSADRVPEVVRQAFQEKFQTVGSAEWKLKSDKNYEAEFTLAGTEIAAKFDPSGKWLETESAIPTSQVPPRVQETVARRFKDYKVIETQSLERSDAPQLLYELHMGNGREIVKAQFSADGAILTQSAKHKS